MRVLITGIAGFVGTWLAEHLVENHPEAEVWGLDRWDSSREELRGIEPLVRFVAADLADLSSLLRALQAARPEVVFHLAAFSTVSSSWGTPAEILQVNAVGQVHLLEAMRNLGLEPVTVIACSAEAYGRVAASDNPVAEGHPLLPISPYGVSKAAQDLLGYQYHASYGFPTVRLRLFNHSGPAGRTASPSRASPASWRRSKRACARRCSRWGSSTWCATSPTSATSPTPTGWRRALAARERSTTSAPAGR